MKSLRYNPCNLLKLKKKRNDTIQTQKQRRKKCEEMSVSKEGIYTTLICYRYIIKNYNYNYNYNDILLYDVDALKN